MVKEADPSVLTDYEKEERARRDEEARMIYVREQGIERGIEQGKFQEKVSTYQTMHKKGVDDESFLEFTDTTQETLNAIKQYLGMKIAPEVKTESSKPKNQDFGMKM